MSNKVQFGLSNVYVNSLTFGANNTPTYGTSEKIDGAVDLTVDSSSDSTTFYADNIAYYITDGAVATELTLTMALFPDWFKRKYLGQKTDSDGNIVETGLDRPQPFALAFQVEGDEKATRHRYFYCIAKKPNLTAHTKEESVEVQTEEITINAYALGDDQILKNKTTDDTTSAKYDAWFESVTLPTLVTNA